MPVAIGIFYNLGKVMPFLPKNRQIIKKVEFFITDFHPHCV